MTTKTSTKPTHRAYLVNGDGDDARWTEVGALFAHKDGKGFNLQLASGLSVSNRIVLRPAKAAAGTAANGKEGQE